MVPTADAKMTRQMLYALELPTTAARLAMDPP
jgi:hypothetical protein